MENVYDLYERCEFSRVIKYHFEKKIVFSLTISFPQQRENTKAHLDAETSSA